MTIRWIVQPPERPEFFRMEWLESGGPAVKTTARHGFGQRVVTRLAAQALDASISYELRPEGLWWLLEMPARFLVKREASVGLAAKPSPGDSMGLASRHNDDVPSAKRVEETMSYYFSKTTDLTFDEAVAATKQALARRDFGVLTEIDMRKNLKRGLNVDFHPYLILGVCNAPLSHRALQAEDKIGTMLPCNIVIQQRTDDRVEISAVDPVASMQAIPNVVVSQVAQDMRSLLRQVIGDLGAALPPRRNANQE